jgi:phage baseplate assembly protein V
LNEQGTLISASGDVAQGTFIPGLYGNGGPPPDNRDHVEVWHFEDGGRLVYDWQDSIYSITLPTGTVSIKVGATQAEVTDTAVTVKSGTVDLEATVNIKGPVNIDGPLHVTRDITSDGAILDTTGNSNHHKH